MFYKILLELLLHHLKFLHIIAKSLLTYYQCCTFILFAPKKIANTKIYARLL